MVLEGLDCDESVSSMVWEHEILRNFPFKYLKSFMPNFFFTESEISFDIAVDQLVKRAQRQCGLKCCLRRDMWPTLPPGQC